MLLTEALMHRHVWAVYFATGAQATEAVLRAPFALGYQQFGVSVFWMMRSFGAGVGASFAVQGIASAASIAGAWWLWRDRQKALPALECFALSRTHSMFFLRAISCDWTESADSIQSHIALGHALIN